MQIVKYRVEHENKLISMLLCEPDWQSFVNERRLADFKASLLNSDTYILLNEAGVQGYVRALVDTFGVYVSELYVCPAQRRLGFGRQLLGRVRSEHPDADVYVFSDEDDYYEQLGCKRVGSIFQL